MNNNIESVGEAQNVFINEPMDLEQIKLTLALMQLDAADRAVIRVADQRDAMQKRAFTIWVNQQLSIHGLYVNDLFNDFRDGRLLIRLIEILSGQKLSVEFGSLPVHCIQNVKRVLDFLEFRKVRIVNIRPEEIVDGNPKLTLGLIWIIILHFHLSDLLHLPNEVVIGTENAVPPDLTVGGSRMFLENGSVQSLALLDESAARNLLAWCRAVTAGYSGVDVTDFSSSWSDGRAFLAIIHRYKPHLFDYAKEVNRPTRDVLEFAFRTAEEKLGITRLIYPEDMVGTENTVDSRSVIIYVSSLYDALALSSRDFITGVRQPLPIPPLPVDVCVSTAPPPLGSQLVSTANVSEDLKALWSEYRLLAAELTRWLRATCDQMAIRHFPPDLKSLQQVVADLKQHRRDELPRRELQKQQLVRLYADLQSAADANMLRIDPFMKIEHIFRLWKEYELALQKREMAVTAEVSRLERLQMAGERIERECGIVQTQEAALEKRMNEVEPEFVTSHSMEADAELRRWMVQLDVIEKGVNNLFAQVQILRNGHYFRIEQVYRRVCTLHQRFLELQRRCRNYRKVSFLGQSNERLQKSLTNGDGLMAMYGDQSREKSNLKILAERSKHFGALQAALDWIREQKEATENSPFGENRKSIADAKNRFERSHKELENYASEVQRIRNLRREVPQEEVRFFDAVISQVESQYNELVKSSRKRLDFSRSLNLFVERASESLQWLRAKETIEVTRIWSSPKELQATEIYEFYRGLLREIQSQEQQFNEISTLGSSLHIEGHPCFGLIQTYLTSLDSHWAWLLQLTHCLEVRLDRTVRYQQFFTEAKEIERFIACKMEELSDIKNACGSGNSPLERSRNLALNISKMGQEIRDQSSRLNKLMAMTDDIIELVPPHEQNTPVTSICFFSPSSEPHYMDLAPNTSDPSIVTWPSGNFEKGERLTLVSAIDFILKLRRSNGESLEAPSACFLPARPCAEARCQAQNIALRFQSLQFTWADVEQSLHGLLLKTTLQALPETLPSLSNSEKQDLLKRLQEDTQRHLVGMRLANKPVQEIEAFQQQSEQCLQSFQSSTEHAVNGLNPSAVSHDFKRIETAINALTDHLRNQNEQVLPNETSALEAAMRQHKEWNKSAQQIKSHLERIAKSYYSDQGKSAKENTEALALLAAANELINAGKASTRRLAEVDLILTRLDSIQRELALAESKVVDIAAEIHSPRQNCFGSRMSLRSDVSEVEANNIQNVHDQLRDVTMSLSVLRRNVEQLPHQLATLSTQTVITDRYRLPPPNTSLLEKSISSVNGRLGDLVGQIDSMNRDLAEVCQNYKSVTALRRGITVWLNETADVVDASESSFRGKSHRGLIPSTAAKNLEHASAEVGHCEAKLKELCQLCEVLSNSLENSASTNDAYKRTVSVLPFASDKTALKQFVGPPGIGIMDIAGLKSSVSRLDDQFQALRSRINDNLQIIDAQMDESRVAHPTSSLRSLLSPSCCTMGDVGDYFTLGGSCHRKRRKIVPTLYPYASEERRKPFKCKLVRHCVISGFYYTSPKQTLRIETAITNSMIREGRVNVRNNLVYDNESGAMITVGEALSKSIVVGIVFTMSVVNAAGEKTYWLEIFHKRHDVFTVEGFYDVNTKAVVTVEEALENKLIDPVRGVYHHKGTGEIITLEEAHQQGLIRIVPQLRPPCEDMVAKPFDTIYYRTVEDDFLVRPKSVSCRQEENLVVQKETSLPNMGEDSKVPLDLHLFGNLTPVTMTDGTAISAIKLPLVRRLMAQNLPTIEAERCGLQSPSRFSLATAISRGWIDPRTGRLRSSAGALSQLNLFEAIENKIIDADSIIVSVGRQDGGSSGRSRNYPLSSVLEAANSIAGSENFTPKVNWQNEVLSNILMANMSATEEEVSEELSPGDCARLRSMIEGKTGKGDKKMRHTRITLKPKKNKDDNKDHEKLTGEEKLSLARAIRSGRFDPVSMTFETANMQRITLQEAIELDVIDTENSLVQDERNGHYRSVASYLKEDSPPVEIWIHWPMATLLSPLEVVEFGCKRLERGQKIPYASAQALNLIKPQSRLVLNPRTETYISILRGFSEGPLCGQRTIIFFRTMNEYISVDDLVTANPENVVSELLFNRSMSIELDSDLFDAIRSKNSEDFSRNPTVTGPVNLKTAVALGWVDPRTGFINDPRTGHRLLLKEAVNTRLIDAEKTLVQDPNSRQVSTLDVILKSGVPVNVPLLIRMTCADKADTPMLASHDSDLSTTADGNQLQTDDSSNQSFSIGHKQNDNRVSHKEDLPHESKDSAFDELSTATRGNENGTADAPSKGRLSSSVADAVSKVGTGLVYTLGAAVVGSSTAYQEVRDKIKSGKTPAIGNERLSGGYERIVTPTTNPDTNLPARLQRPSPPSSDHSASLKSPKWGLSLDDYLKQGKAGSEDPKRKSKDEPSTGSQENDQAQPLQTDLAKESQNSKGSQAVSFGNSLMKQLSSEYETECEGDTPYRDDGRRISESVEGSERVDNSPFWNDQKPMDFGNEVEGSRFNDSPAKFVKDKFRPGNTSELTNAESTEKVPQTSETGLSDGQTEDNPKSSKENFKMVIEKESDNLIRGSGGSGSPTPTYYQEIQSEDSFSQFEGGKEMESPQPDRQTQLGSGAEQLASQDDAYFANDNVLRQPEDSASRKGGQYLKPDEGPLPFGYDDETKFSEADREAPLESDLIHMSQSEVSNKKNCDDVAKPEETLPLLGKDNEVDLTQTGQEVQSNSNSELDEIRNNAFPAVGIAPSQLEGTPSKTGEGVKKALIGVGGALAAVVGAPVLAGVMAYKAAKEKLDSRAQASTEKPIAGSEEGTIELVEDSDTSGARVTLDQVGYQETQLSSDSITKAADEAVTQIVGDSKLPEQSENQPQEISRILQELERDSEWLSVMQERVLKIESVTLNDYDNQKLMDQYYEINNCLLTRRQACLDHCTNAEQLAQDSISSLPLESRSLLKVKAAEIRSKFEQLAQVTNSQIRLLTANLETLEQLTFQLQDSKTWLINAEKVLTETLNASDLRPENLFAIYGPIQHAQRDLNSRHADITAVITRAQQFLSSLDKYNSAKKEYANRIGATILDAHEASKDVEASVEAAVTWTQDKFSQLKALIGDKAKLYAEAANDYGDFSDELTKCHDSLDMIEKSFRTAVRKLLAAGVDVNPRCEPEARAPVNPELITNSDLVRDLTSSLFAVEEDMEQLKHAMENVDKLADELCENKLPKVSISTAVINASIKQPLNTEWARLDSISKDLDSIRDDLKRLLGVIGVSENAVSDTTAWLASTFSYEKASGLSEALQGNKELQSQLVTRELELESSLLTNEENLSKVEESGGTAEEIAAAKAKVENTKNLLNKCADMHNKLIRNKDMLNELEQVHALTDTVSRNLKHLLDDSSSDLTELEAAKNERESELQTIEEILNSIEPEAGDVGLDSDVKSAKAKIEVAKKNIEDLGQAIDKARSTCDEFSTRNSQFETARAKLLDWLQSLETRLGVGVFTSTTNVNEASICERLRELEEISAECNALESEVEVAFSLLNSTNESVTEKLSQEGEELKSRCRGLKDRVASMKLDAKNALDGLEAFSRAHSKVDAWLNQQLAHVSQCKIFSSNSQDILALSKKLTGLKKEIESVSPRFSSLKQLGNELIAQSKSGGKGPSRIRDQLNNVERKFQTLNSLCNQRAAEVAETYSQAIALDQCYQDLDSQLRQYSQSFSDLSSDSSSKEQLQKLLSLQFALTRCEPMVRGFEDAAGQFINSLLDSADTSELSGRISGARSRFDGLMGAIDSRLEMFQSTLTPKLEDESEKYDTNRPNVTDENPKVTGSEFESKLLKELTDGVQASTETKETDSIQSLSTESISKEALQEKLSAFQSWLELEEGTAKLSLFESGSYPVTNSSVSKAIQRAETSLALIESRSKQLESLFAESNESRSPEISNELKSCQARLNLITERYSNKNAALREILIESKPIELALQTEHLEMAKLESRFCKDLGSSSHLEALQEDLKASNFSPIEPQIAKLEETLVRLGDGNAGQSTAPLRESALDLEKCRKRLESSLQRAIESGQGDQEAISCVMNRGDILRRRLNELKSQLDMADPSDSSFDPETIARKMDYVNSVLEKLSECEATLKTLKAEKKDMPPCPMLNNLIKDLKLRASLIRNRANDSSEKLAQKADLASNFVSQRERLGSMLANARISSSVQARMALPSAEELQNYEQKHLKPLGEQLELVKQAGRMLSDLIQPVTEKRSLEEDIEAASAAVDSVFASVNEVNEQISGAPASGSAVVSDARRLESLVQHVHDELNAQGPLTMSMNMLQMDANLNKLTSLRNLLHSHQGSLERLSNSAKADSKLSDFDKLVNDYQEVSGDVESRIARVSDTLVRLKEFSDLYDSYLRWLEDAEKRFKNLPTECDPASTYNKRVEELAKIMQECADQADAIIQLQTRGTELLGLCSALSTSGIKDKMEHVGSSFTEFYARVTAASQGFNSCQSEIAGLLDSNAYLTEILSEIESKLRSGENSQSIVEELDTQVKPYVDALLGHMEKIRKNLRDSLFLDLPSQLNGMSIGGLADDNISRFNSLYNEATNGSKPDKNLKSQIQDACLKLQDDEKWLADAINRLGPKSRSHTSMTSSGSKREANLEGASRSFIDLPVRADEIEPLVEELKGLKSSHSKRQPDIESHLTESKRLLALIPKQNAEEDLAPTLSGLVKRVTQKNKDIDGLLDSADSRVRQALALSKSLFDGLAGLESWLSSTEAVLEQLPVTPLAVEEESEMLKKLYETAKVRQETLEQDMDSYKVTLEQAMSTATALSALTTPEEFAGVNETVQDVAKRFQKIARRVRNRSIDLEDAVSNSTDINDRLNRFNEVLNETRDLAASIGVRLDPPSNDLSSSNLPSEFDPTISTSRVQQPVSLRSTYLSGQIVEGKAILGSIERRLPALKELTNTIEECLSSLASGTSSKAKDSSAIFEDIPPDDNVLYRAQSLQKDWLQMHAKVSQRLTNLVEAHRLASEEFWLPLSRIQAELIALRQKMDSLVSETVSKGPLEPSTYVRQIDALQNVSGDIQTIDEGLKMLRGVGDKIIGLLIDEKSRGDNEKSILKNEINNAIEDVSVVTQNLTTLCNLQQDEAESHLDRAQKLQADLNKFFELLEKAEGELEQLEPVPKSSDKILDQMAYLEKWSSSVFPEHELLENITWVAGQLMSAAGLPEEPVPQDFFDDKKPNLKDMRVQDLLASATARWSDLSDALNCRRHDLQTELMKFGDFESALDALIRWIKATQVEIDAVVVSRGDKKSLEFEMAQAKMIQTNAARRQPDVLRINKEASAVPQSQRSSKLVELNQLWDKLKESILVKQVKLDEALREIQHFYSQLEELRRECRHLEGKIYAPGARLIGGLPDSAKQSLNKFNRFNSSVEDLGNQIENLFSSSAGLLASAETTRDRLVGHLDGLREQQAQLASQSKSCLKRVKSGVARVTAFHNDLGDFIQWLTQAERRMAQVSGISYVPSTLQLQLPVQTALRREIASKRESALTPLDRAVVFIGSHAFEQDVVLVKNLLASAHSRWEKLSQKSTDRSRQLATAFKESQKLVLAWQKLTDWLNNELDTRLQESSWASLSTQPDVLTRELTQHREFQRELGVHSSAYDAVRRQLMKIKDKAPRDDFVELNRMLSELKYLWNAVCAKSLEKQKVLEEALLRSGQYNGAFASLFEWIGKIENQLDESEKKGCAGDIETLKQFEEANQSVLVQLQEREASVAKLRATAAQLLSKCRPEGCDEAAELTDSLLMQEQLAGLNSRWVKVQMRAKSRAEALKEAHKNAEEFQKSCQDVFDYCAGAEYALRKLGALAEGDDPVLMDSTDLLAEENSINTEAAAITTGMAAQESRVCDCLARGNKILAGCKNNPDAATRIRQWMNAVNTRWEEMLTWSQNREARLAQLFKEQRQRRLTLDALISWLNTMEVILRSDRMSVQPSISTGPVSTEVTSEISSGSSSRFETCSIGFEIDTSQVERLLVEVGQFELELEKRSSERDELLRHARKIDVAALKRTTGSRGQASETSQNDKSKAYASNRVNVLCDKWDMVAKLIKARRMALEDRLAHANEVEKLKSFDFGAWRKRYLEWLNAKKARLIDMFYRYDKDRDGQLTRDEFVNAILESKFSTSRLELELVAAIVDANGDGYIDMKKFNAALRSNTVPKPQYIDLSKIEGTAIEHEAKHQTSLCTCRNTYRISKITGNMYKFGDSQKLRLVRILRSNVMVRVGGGWTPLTEFLVKNDPCRVYFYTDEETERGKLSAFWTGREADRKDAGFPDDQTHMMLKFHPRFRDGSSASLTCTDPACSGHVEEVSMSALKRSNPRQISASGGSPLKSISPTQVPWKSSLRANDDSRYPVRSSLPLSTIRRRMNSPYSSHQNSLSSSAQSLPVVQQSGPRESPVSSQLGSAEYSSNNVVSEIHNVEKAAVASPDYLSLSPTSLDVLTPTSRIACLSSISEWNEISETAATSRRQPIGESRGETLADASEASSLVLTSPRLSGVAQIQSPSAELPDTPVEKDPK